VLSNMLSPWHLIMKHLIAIWILAVVDRTLSLRLLPLLRLHINYIILAPWQ
jgi:hypothetical protein